MFNESKLGGVTIGMSFVVRIVGQAIFVPALEPIYEIEFSETRFIIPSRKPVSYREFKRRNEFPPPTKICEKLSNSLLSNLRVWAPIASLPINFLKAVFTKSK